MPANKGVRRKPRTRFLMAPHLSGCYRDINADSSAGFDLGPVCGVARLGGKEVDGVYALPKNTSGRDSTANGFSPRVFKDAGKNFAGAE